MRAILGLVGFLVLTFAAAGIGGYFTGQSVREWYPALAKPAWTPPSWLFGPVWTILYVCIAVAGWLAWQRGGFGAHPFAWAVFFAQLILNAAWSWIFFGLRQPGYAAGEIVILWLMILAATVGFFRITAPAGWLFVPYLLWVSYASALNAAIWRLNA